VRPRNMDVDRRSPAPTPSVASPSGGARPVTASPHLCGSRPSGCARSPRVPPPVQEHLRPARTGRAGVRLLDARIGDACPQFRLSPKRGPDCPTGVVSRLTRASTEAPSAGGFKKEPDPRTHGLSPVVSSNSPRSCPGDWPHPTKGDDSLESHEPPPLPICRFAGHVRRTSPRDQRPAPAQIECSVAARMSGKRRSPRTPEGRNPGSPGGCGRRRERSPTSRLIGRAGYGQHQGRRGRVILAEGLQRSWLTPVRSKCDLL
jgi:hypothetical protein